MPDSYVFRQVHELARRVRDLRYGAACLQPAVALQCRSLTPPTPAGICRANVLASLPCGHCPLLTDQLHSFLVRFFLSLKRPCNQPLQDRPVSEPEVPFPLPQHPYIHSTHSHPHSPTRTHPLTHPPTPALTSRPPRIPNHPSALAPSTCASPPALAYPPRPCRYGIQDGLHYVTLQGLVDHYRDDRDGYS